MTKLSVNVNKIATLRNTRTLEIPSLTHLSRLALRAGAHGITVHPRPDQRHIRPADVPAIAAVVAEFAGAEYNIEGNPFHGLVEHCESVKPTQATLVPDAREAFTSNHGWNLVELFAPERKALSHAIERLHAIGCRVSLFMDPIAEMMPIAQQLGADRVELYTEPYAAAHAQGNFAAVLQRYAEAARAALDLGLQVNAGHDLSLLNLPDFIAAIPQIAEVSIGHALIADALELGLPATITHYLAACTPPRTQPS